MARQLRLLPDELIRRDTSSFSDSLIGVPEQQYPYLGMIRGGVDVSCVSIGENRSVFSRISHIQIRLVIFLSEHQIQSFGPAI